ncbi:SDR family NAD(P)-dependent oxidoreductase [Paraburkholderia strydomiana]|uniref:SDR family NAD(P)-dependent oxidoreductase n=1 Tax=Paraburkholderia strydomiana TaxID=1245417 RepID=UPI0038B8D389
MSLAGKTLLMSGGSRGIGLAIALRAARDGANVGICAKTADPDPLLEGTIHTGAAAVQAAGGKALQLLVDTRDEERVKAAVAEAIGLFGIDILVNNASAIRLTGTKFCWQSACATSHSTTCRLGPHCKRISLWKGCGACRRQTI